MLNINKATKIILFLEHDEVVAYVRFIRVHVVCLLINVLLVNV